ncbi:MAG: tRNA (adenosine(37)-N6)-threonylcarbamoyltransferase complex dimerization subunit type 1 TsaB [Kofleriaceae bacterium]
MKLLGLDTATMTAGIAILDGDRVLVDARHDASGRSADLLVAIDAAFARAGFAPTELDAISIGAGPGSFTGLRIGMATAKGIAFATGRPLWMVSTLAALAEDARQSLPPARRIHVAAIDARRGEIYAACYGPDLALLGVERVLPPGELAAWVAELAGDLPIVVAGDGLASYREALAPLADRWLPIATPSGVGVARLALAGPRTDMLAAGAPRTSGPPRPR